MQRRTVDLLFSAGGLGVAVLLVVIGLVLSSDARFSRNYVSDQLGQQKISFKAADALTDAEKASPCVVANAGQAVTTGKQAECFANDYIGVHLQDIGGGLTYSELGVPQRALRDQVAEAEAANDPALPTLEAELAELNDQRRRVFEGETLRGLLLTTYGFSELGEKADQVAKVAFGIAALLALLSIAGFAHALRTPRTRAFAAPEIAEPAMRQRVPAGA